MPCMAQATLAPACGVSSPHSHADVGKCAQGDMVLDEDEKNPFCKSVRMGQDEVSNVVAF